MSRDEIAEWSRATEIEELGVAGGSQDHYAAAYGGALGLWFDESVRVRQLQLADETRAAIERRCIVAYTGQSRISGNTITAVLDAYRAREPRVTQALARMKALAEQMIVTLEEGDVDALAELVGEHWVHQRALHPSITTPEIERLMDAARSAGAIGGKALGASGGGCVAVFAPEGRVDAVRAVVAELAEPLTFEIDVEGVHVE
jgi:D-glycero-alpha-D-manno-heptose-7-phosphate kinase